MFTDVLGALNISGNKSKKGALIGCNFIKKTLTQVFSCEYCEIFKNTYFEEHLRTAASIGTMYEENKRLTPWTADLTKNSKLKMGKLQEARELDFT